MKPLPTLTTGHWLSDTANTANQLFDYFLVCEYSQSRFYRGYVASLPYLVQQYAHAPDILAQQIRDTLYRLYSGYFDKVRISAEPTDVQNDSGKYNISVDAMVSDGKSMHSLGRLIWIGESSILGVEDTGGPELIQRG